MGRTFKRDAVAPAAEASEEEDEEADTKPALTSGDVFRRLSGSRIKQEEAESSVTDDNGNGNERKLSFHSGLSALIEAATTQLSQVDDGNNLAHGQTSTGTTPRYTPHGFHTNSTATKKPYNSVTSPSLLQTTPILRPEATGLTSLSAVASTTEARQQTFPEILMTVLEDSANANVATFLPDGQFFALRRKEFSETSMMSTYFAAASFGEFLEKIHNWGFFRIIDHRTAAAAAASAGDTEDPPDYSSGIEIFRHPMFAKGDWERCSRICFGESPTDVRLSALPDRARIEYTLSDESTLNASKRRLSPSHTRRASESSLSKQRLSSTDIHDVFDAAISKSESAETTSTDASAKNTACTPSHHRPDAATTTENNVSSSPSLSVSKMEEDLRSLALAITTEKLDLKTDVDDDGDASTPLIQKAVENATCTIVTDAIETLLRDEDHTRETYLKHERELSKSSLPGIVPISKQLFAQEPPSQDIQENLLAAAAAAAEVIVISDSRNTTKKINTNGENAKATHQRKERKGDKAVVSNNKGNTTTDRPPAPKTSSSEEDQSLRVAKLTPSSSGDDALTTSSST